MENLEHGNSEWVKSCVELLGAPADWEPDVRLARARFEIRMEDRARRNAGLKRYLLAGAAAAVALCVAVPSIPQTRVFAQQLGNRSTLLINQFWDWITVVRPGPVLLTRYSESAKVLRLQRLSGPETRQVASNPAEASALAGFSSKLPDLGELAGSSNSPRLSVLGPSSFASIVSIEDLRQTQWIPTDWERWDGSQVTLQVSSAVIAHWSNVDVWTEVTLAQIQPPVVTAPQGFDSRMFCAIALQAAGMRNSDMLVALAQRHGTTLPALLFGYETPYKVGVRDIGVRSRGASLIEEFGAQDSAPVIERLSLLWSTSDRWYLLSGVPQDRAGLFSAGMARAVASILDLANAIPDSRE